MKWLRWIGVLGGLLWIISWTKVSLYPPAPAGGYREGEDVHGILIAAILLLAFGQLVWLSAERAFLGLAAKISLGVVPVAILLMAIGRFNQALGGDPQPAVAIGWILTAVSMLTLSFALGKRYALWIRALILVAAICFGLLSEQDWRSWLALPYGMCWSILFLLHTRKRSANARVTSSL
ncbi:hypothetical protein [Paenibacillus sp. HJGM_3]|uniref:hypothetical protein n=1 Tax=Paenibacillus sp. HJGM_3 TaxID=3379816 RepID=UPI00385AC4A3